MVLLIDGRRKNQVPLLLYVYGSEIFINLYNIKINVHKLLAILKGIVEGGASIDFIDKSAVSRTPGDVTELGHN